MRSRDTSGKSRQPQVFPWAPLATFAATLPRQKLTKMPAYARDCKRNPPDRLNLSFHTSGVSQRLPNWPLGSSSMLLDNLPNPFMQLPSSPSFGFPVLQLGIDLAKPARFSEPAQLISWPPASPFTTGVTRQNFLHHTFLPPKKISQLLIKL